uniref:Uncharacterized protein n=1 Tax=Rhodopseudomonas palustris (strain BisA53) TaxID=316055 RepID=Q07L97_RHOP5
MLIASSRGRSRLRSCRDRGVAMPLSAPNRSIRPANQRRAIRRKRPVLRARRRREGGKLKNFFVAKFSDSESRRAHFGAEARVASIDRSIS